MKRSIALPLLLVLIGIVAIAGQAPSGYYIVAPGGSYEVTSRLEVPAEHREESGRLAFTAVFAGPGRWSDVVDAWLDPVIEAVPAEQVRPRDVSPEEFREINERLIEESKSVAAVVALQAAGHDARVTGDGAEVHGLLEGMPAASVLQVGDVIVGVDGQPVQTAVEVVELTRRRQVGQQVHLEFIRDGQRHEVVVGTHDSPSEPGRPVIGAAIGTHNFDVVLPFPVQIDTDDIGGASAGAIFALGILDVVTEGVLTRGHYVAGTGTILADRTVGPVGGVAQKVVAAEQDGATVFLVPRQNEEQARQAARSIQIVPIDRFEDAVRALCDLEPTGEVSPDLPSPCAGEVAP